MAGWTTCRDEVLECARHIVRKKGKNEFTVAEIINTMHLRGSQYKESTIKTHVTSRMCSNSPDHHTVTYDDFERVDVGLYRLSRHQEK